MPLILLASQAPQDTESGQAARAQGPREQLEQAQSTSSEDSNPKNRPISVRQDDTAALGITNDCPLRSGVKNVVEDYFLSLYGLRCARLDSAAPTIDQKESSERAPVDLLSANTWNYADTELLYSVITQKGMR